METLERVSMHRQRGLYRRSELLSEAVQNLGAIVSNYVQRWLKEKDTSYIFL